MLLSVLYKYIAMHTHTVHIYIVHVHTQLRHTVATHAHNKAQTQTQHTALQ